MTEENVAATEEPKNLEIGIEQICAAILATVGKTTVKLDTLLNNFAGQQIKVEQNEDGSVSFELIEGEING